jgi:hypothetical protein
MTYSAVFGKLPQGLLSGFDLKTFDDTEDCSFPTCQHLLGFALLISKSKVEKVFAPFEVTHGSYTSDSYWFDVLFRVHKCVTMYSPWGRRAQRGFSYSEKQCLDAGDVLGLVYATIHFLETVVAPKDKWPLLFQTKVINPLIETYHLIRVNALVAYSTQPDFEPKAAQLLAQAAVLQRELNKGLSDNDLDHRALRAGILHMHKCGAASQLDILSRMLQIYGSVQDPEIAHVCTEVAKLQLLHIKNEDKKQPQFSTVYGYLQWATYKKKPLLVQGRFD